MKTGDWVIVNDSGEIGQIVIEDYLGATGGNVRWHLVMRNSHALNTVRPETELTYLDPSLYPLLNSTKGKSKWES